MQTIFENEDFRLNLTGHDYDFVGIIETKGDEPLTFFFEEELCEGGSYEDSDNEDYIDEDQTKLLDVYKGLKPYDGEDWESDDEEAIAEDLCASSYFRTRDDKSSGFLSEPRKRGQFLAIVKHYCPDQLANIPWA